MNDEYNVIPLTKQFAEDHIKQLVDIANLIPEVDYSSDDILADSKGDRLIQNKWNHSLVALNNAGEPVAFITGYERMAEGNNQYPENTLYVSELAVAEQWQKKGLAKRLLRDFFHLNNDLGFLSLEGELNYSIQTNSADWNQHVVDLYGSFGFIQRARKEYPNRVDIVLGAKASDLIF